MVPSSLLILSSSVCKSLQCLISTLTQGLKVVTDLDSLFQLCCGEGGILQINITGMCVGSAFSVWTTLGLPQLTEVCAFLNLHCSGSRLFYRGTVQRGPCISCTFLVGLLNFWDVPQEHRLLYAVCLLCGADFRLYYSWQM